MRGIFVDNRNQELLDETSINYNDTADVRMLFQKNQGGCHLNENK